MDERYLSQTRRLGSEEYLTVLIDELAELDIAEIEVALQRLFANAYNEILGAVLLTRMLSTVDD